jgi:precorrin-3B C17-methyltransferase
LKDACGDDRPVVFARNVSRPDETIKIVPLSQTTADMADMRTMVLVGSSQTRIIERDIGPIVYTPRSMLK